MSRRAFTVLELIVVVVIIALLVTIASFSVVPLRRKANDTKRLKDVDNIRAALNLYKQEIGFYPPELKIGEALIGNNGQTYLSKVPTNTKDETCGGEYSYSSKNNGFDYNLSYCLSTKVDNLKAGTCVARASTLCCEKQCSGKCGGDDGCGQECPNTCSGSKPFCANDSKTCIAYPECPISICGDCRTTTCGSTCNTTITKNGSSQPESYGTKQIGTQCVLTKSITNVGTMVNAGVYANDNLVERWCPGPSFSTSTAGTEASCTAYAALYAWNEAMYLPASFNNVRFTAYTDSGINAKRQGLCPKGWHVISDYEMEALENALDSTVLAPASSGLCISGTHGLYADNMCSYTNVSYADRGTDIGTKLKVGGSSGFNLALAGYYVPSSGKFYNRGEYGFLWTTSHTLTNYNWNRTVSSSSGKVTRGYSIKNIGFQVRCIKD